MIMIKRLQYIPYYIAALLGCCACSDFLNEESADEVIVKTVSDYSELLLGSGYPSPTGKLYNILYLLDDDYMLNERAMYNDEDYQSAISVFPFYTWQPDMWENQNVNKSYYDDSYSMTYERIVGVNAVLDGIDEAIGEEEEREQVKAEALALRGYYYFMLVNLYAKPYNVDKEGLGVPLKLTADIETTGQPRNSVAEVYRQITEDMESASALFEKYAKRRGSFRINLPSVNILLCRAYLQMEEWDKVIACATKAIESGNPLTNYTNLPAKNGTFSNYDYSEVEWLYGNGFTSCSLPGLKASDELLALYAQNGDDTRPALWFYNGNVYKKRLGSKRTPTNAIRMSEAYLSRAEAYAKKNDVQKAAADLNHLRMNRYRNYAGESFADATLLMDEIRKERRLELCYDDVRWFDLRRYGMPSITHLYKVRQNAAWQRFTLQEKDPLYTLPIPNEVINENVALKQNESANQPARQGSL